MDNPRIYLYDMHRRLAAIWKSSLAMWKTNENRPTSDPTRTNENQREPASDPMRTNENQQKPTRTNQCTPVIQRELTKTDENQREPTSALQ